MVSTRTLVDNAGSLKELGFMDTILLVLPHGRARLQWVLDPPHSRAGVARTLAPPHGRFRLINSSSTISYS